MARSGSGAVFSRVRGCLVATPLGDFDAAGAERFRADLSARLQHERFAGVVLDVSALEVMDAHDFAWVRGALQVAALMGASAMLAGLSPEVVAALVRLDVDLSGVAAELTVDRAVEALERAA
jgi:rsbT co-antagonist protein RsbR